MTPAQIADAARLHGMWARGEDGGKHAVLTGAVLRTAVLTGADLRGAVLRGAVLTDVIGYVVGPQRSDCYRFDLTWRDGAWRVVAGCQTRHGYTTAQFRDRAAKYPDAAKRAETLAILDYLDARASVTPTERKATA